MKRESYSRTTAAGGAITDAIATRYGWRKAQGLPGRRIPGDGSSYAMLDYSQSQYTGYGEVWKNGVNGLWQTENQNDNGGRLTATNGR